MPRRTACFLGGILFVAVLGGLVRPRQGDLAHTIGLLAAGGGRAVHSAHFQAGQDCLGRYTIFVTASVVPPVTGDVRVDLNGPAPVRYSLASRYPPVWPLANQGRPWYRFEDGVLKGLRPGDDVVVVARLEGSPPPGEYVLTFSDVRTGRPYLVMPVIFEQACPAGVDAAGAVPPCCE